MSPSRSALAGALAIIMALAASAAAAGPGPAHVDPAHFQELRWRLVGPFRGGRVLAVAGVPGEREHFYFGSVNGGVWETIDAGRTWRPIFGLALLPAVGVPS